MAEQTAITKALIDVLRNGNPAKDPQFRSDIYSRLLDVSHGVSRGISADLIGGPVDMAATFLSIPRMLGATSWPDFRDRPIGGSQHIGEMMQNIGLLRAPTGTTAETAGRVVGGMMASPRVVGPVMSTAENTARAAVNNAMTPGPSNSAIGRQLGMYAFHGTSSPEFKKFDSSYRGSHTNAPDAERAFFFTRDKGDAATYADWATEKIGGTPRVLSAHLGVKNPLILGTELNKDNSVRGPLLERLINNKKYAFQYAKQRGYDAVYWPDGNDTDLPNTIAVFDGDQIRILKQDVPLR